MREVQELTHARLEPTISGCPGLFAARARPGHLLHVEQRIGDVTLRFRGERMGAADLMVLAVLVAIAGPGGARPCADHEEESALVNALEVRPVELAEGSLVIETLMARLLSECAVQDGGVQRRAVLESLRRLAQLTVFVKREQCEVSMHLLSFAIDERNGALRVALSPRVTVAILGGRHTRIMLAEMRALGALARVLYARLCSWIDPGLTRRVSIEVIERYLCESSAEGSAGREQRRRARGALAELGRLAGWRVHPDARRRQYTITRPGAETVGCVTEAVGRMTEAVGCVTHN